MDLCHRGAAGAVREKVVCLPGSGIFLSLPVPAAVGTSCGAHLSQLRSSLTGGGY